MMQTQEASTYSLQQTKTRDSRRGRLMPIMTKRFAGFWSQGKIDVLAIINGVLGSLVAVTGAVEFVTSQCLAGTAPSIPVSDQIYTNS